MATEAVAAAAVQRGLRLKHGLSARPAVANLQQLVAAEALLLPLPSRPNGPPSRKRKSTARTDSSVSNRAAKAGKARSAKSVAVSEVYMSLFVQVYYILGYVWYACIYAVNRSLEF